MTSIGRVRSAWQRIGPRAHDVAFIVIATIGVLAVAVGRPDAGGTRHALVVAVAAAGVVPLWWRRQAPLAVTLVGLVVLLLTGDPITAMIGLFTLAIRRRDRVLVAATVGAALVSTARGVLDQGWEQLPTHLFGGVLGAGFFAAAGAYIGARRDLVASLRERADRAERERELLAEQAKVGERARIAREMHDVLAHKVSLIALHAGALEVNTDDPRTRESAALIRTTAAQAMDDLREVLGVLRAGGGQDEDLRPHVVADGIERIIEDSRAAGVRVTLHVDGPVLPDALARTAHRIVQEALTNVHKHARGAATAVTLSADEAAGVTIEVLNQRPVAADALLPGSGSGLAGLRERVTLVGGDLEAGPTSAGGWRVGAWLPWPQGTPSTAALVSHRGGER